MESDSKDLYYAYALDDCLGIFTNPSAAVKCAKEAYGCVIDQNGHYIWKKEVYSSKNQIMRIEETTEADEETSSLEKCLEIVLEYEGYSLDVRKDLENGMGVSDILEKNIPDCKGIEIINSDTEEIKYYLNKDIPVIAMAGENTVLVVGYSDTAFVWLNPRSGNLMKVGLDEAKTFYENNGYSFATYVKWNS
jgi:hypothetical protein